MSAGSITKHPIIAALVIAAVLCIVSAFVVLALLPAQQAPWGVAAVVFAYPFVAFAAWLVVNAIGWGKEISER